MRPRPRCGADIKADIEEVVCESLYWIQLTQRIESHSGFFWTG